MAYSTSLPPRLIAQGPSDGGSIWMYQSEDAHGDVDAASYFTNGMALGMKVGDVVLVVETDASYALSMHVVTAVAAAGATVSARITS
jgi:hypothetical protein